MAFRLFTAWVSKLRRFISRYELSAFVAASSPSTDNRHEGPGSLEGFLFEDVDPIRLWRLHID